MTAYFSFSFSFGATHSFFLWLMPNLFFVEVELDRGLEYGKRCNGAGDYEYGMFMALGTEILFC